MPDNGTSATSCPGIRVQLDLFTNLCPVQLCARCLSPLRDVAPNDVDPVIFRENTEGVYVAGQQHTTPAPGGSLGTDEVGDRVCRDLRDIVA